MSTAKTLQKKIIVKAVLETLSGLHIGGSDVGLKIGGADKVVVKDPQTGRPYIPGSTLKGKVRCLLEKAGFCCDGQGMQLNNHQHTKPQWGSCHCGKCVVCKLFGVAAEHGGAGRLIFRDARLSEQSARDMENWRYLSAPFVEVKTEVAIDRLTSQANPRNFERVPAGALFELEVVMDVFKDDDQNQHLAVLHKGLKLLENDYLGGQGTRGYGWVRIKDIEAVEVDIPTMKSTKFDLNDLLEKTESEGSSG